MNLLAIETATEIASLALQVDGKVFSRSAIGAQQHAGLILPMLNSLLSEAAINLSQLDGIVFGRGPGSFTGIRIACSIAKGLAYGQSLPLYPVSSLAAIINTIMLSDQYLLDHEEGVLVMIDARMQQVYWTYAMDVNNIQQECLSDVKSIALSGCNKFLLAGVGWQPYQTQFPMTLSTRISQSVVLYPCAETMLAMVNTGKISPVTVNDALPVYIRNQVTQMSHK